MPESVATTLAVKEPPLANTRRYDSLRDVIEATQAKEIDHAQMSVAELKALRLYGMVSAWTDLTAQGETSTASSKWLIEHLLQAENTDRAMRSVSHQFKAARFSIQRDLD